MRPPSFILLWTPPFSIFSQRDRFCNVQNFSTFELYGHCITVLTYFLFAGFDLLSVNKFSLNNFFDLNTLKAAKFLLYGGQSLTDE